MLTIIIVLFYLFMAVRAVYKKDAASLLFYLFIDITIAASVVEFPGFWSGGDDANLFICAFLGFIDMVCLVIVLMLT